ncbi:hypothetical protein RQP46_006096 [Phenoliferia psychrophenolica]
MRPRLAVSVRSGGWSLAGPSTGRSFSLFNKPGPPSPSKLLAELDSALVAERLDLVARVYPSLVQSVTTLQSPLSGVGKKDSKAAHEQLQRVMAFVASTPRLSLLQRIFNDLPALGLTQTNYDHHLLLRGLARNGKAARALSWIEGMEGTHGVVPLARDWNVVASAFRREGDLDGMRNVLVRMRERGCPPNTVSYNALIAALFDHGQVHEARDVRNEMDALGVKADVWTETTLLSGFVDAGERASAIAVHDRLEPVVQSWEREQGQSSEFDLAAVNALAKYACFVDGFDSGVRLVEGYRDRGYQLNELSLTTLAKEGAVGLSSSKEATDLIERLEGATRVVAGRKAWSIVLNGVLAGPGSLPAALQVLQEARDRSVIPDSTMVQPVLSALVRQPSPESFTIAKRVYEDLATASRAFSSAPDTSVYVTLLRACADPTHPDLEFSRTLLADMRERAVRLDAQSVTWHIVALMRVAVDFPDAFQSYDKVRALDASILTTQAYNIILTAFTSLSFPHLPIDSQIAPPPLILEFLSDMRRTSHPPDAITYSLLLTYYSRHSTASPALIAHLHSLIKLDTNVDPDTPLFNALMGAYSRVGSHISAMRIWDTLRANHQVDTVSVSTVLDAFPNAFRETLAATDQLVRCSRCFKAGVTVRYCDSTCQKEAWPYHKLYCGKPLPTPSFHCPANVQLDHAQPPSASLAHQLTLLNITPYKYDYHFIPKSGIPIGVKILDAVHQTEFRFRRHETLLGSIPTDEVTAILNRSSLPREYHGDPLIRQEMHFAWMDRQRVAMAELLRGAESDDGRVFAAESWKEQIEMEYVYKWDLDPRPYRQTQVAADQLLRCSKCFKAWPYHKRVCGKPLPAPFFERPSHPHLPEPPPESPSLTLQLSLLAGNPTKYDHYFIPTSGAPIGVKILDTVHANEFRLLRYETLIGEYPEGEATAIMNDKGVPTHMKNEMFMKGSMYIGWMDRQKLYMARVLEGAESDEGKVFALEEWQEQMEREFT